MSGHRNGGVYRPRRPAMHLWAALPLSYTSDMRRAVCSHGPDSNQATNPHAQYSNDWSNAMAKSDGGKTTAKEAATVQEFTDKQLKVIRFLGVDPATVNMSVVQNVINGLDEDDGWDDFDRDLAEQDRGTTSTPHPDPAIEEGPHLKDPENRRLKRQAMRDAGWTGDEDFLTDDMREILAEKDEA